MTDKLRSGVLTLTDGSHGSLKRAHVMRLFRSHKATIHRRQHDVSSDITRTNAVSAVQ